MTKFGVVALSESLSLALQRAGGGVSASVLCPAWVNTRIDDSARNRPASVPERTSAPGGPEVDAMRAWVSEQLRAGLDPRAVGDTVLQAIRDDRFYILTHPTWTPLIEQRVQAILQGENPRPGTPPGIETLLQRMAAARS